MPQSAFITLYRNGEEEVLIHYNPIRRKKHGKARVRRCNRRRQETLSPVQTAFKRCCSYLYLCYAAVLGAFGSKAA